jgi:hypothetical protein
MKLTHYLGFPRQCSGTVEQKYFEINHKSSAAMVAALESEEEDYILGLGSCVEGIILSAPLCRECQIQQLKLDGD